MKQQRRNSRQSLEICRKNLQNIILLDKYCWFSIYLFLHDVLFPQCSSCLSSNDYTSCSIKTNGYVCSNDPVGVQKVGVQSSSTKDDKGWMEQHVIHSAKQNLPCCLPMYFCQQYALLKPQTSTQPRIPLPRVRISQC